MSSDMRSVRDLKHAQSINQSILFLTWPNQQTATRYFKDHKAEEQL